MPSRQPRRRRLRRLLRRHLPPATAAPAALRSGCRARRRSRRRPPRLPLRRMPAAAAGRRLSPNKGDTAWMMVSTLLVILMTIPGLALFYGGLVRSKNMLSILLQVFTIFALIIVLWCVYGYSLAFTEGNAFYRQVRPRLPRAASGIRPRPRSPTAATFSKGVVIPEFVYVAFQATFAAITCGLIVGAFAERAKFTAVLAFVVLWFTFAYLPSRPHGLVLDRP
jgi:Amt family ammonium transporter